jgi:uncharacterized protein
MLIDFFYTLRAAKLPVSVKEYLTLLEASRPTWWGRPTPTPAPWTTSTTWRAPRW